MPTLSDAIVAIKAGRNPEAREILTGILAKDPRNIPALLWFTQIAETTDERREYLRRVLAIDPNNAPAKKGLALLGESDEIPPWMNREKQPEPEKTNVPTTITKPDARQQPVTKSRSKRNPYIPLVFVVIVVLGLFVLVSYTVPKMSLSVYPTRQPEPTKTLPPPTERPAPTKTKEPWPELASISSYPSVDRLDLLKRAYYYKNQPICLSFVKVFDVHEEQNGTTFQIQEDSGSYSVIGTVYYPGSLTGLVEDWVFFTLGGYVMGTEADLNLSSSSRPVILMQRGVWIPPNLSSGGYSTIGDSLNDKCGSQ